MLTVDDFRTRVTALWESQKRMAAPRKWKSGKRAGTLRNQGAVIEFTRDDLQRWLWQRVGLNAIPCPYCQAPIDILSLTLDHIVPRSLGGLFRLDNMEPMCHDCNHQKGNMTHDGFVALIIFSRTQLSPYDADILMKRLKAAHHGAAQRFFRGKKDSAPALPAPKPAQQTNLNDIPF